MLKKFNLVVLGLASLLVISCASNKIDPSILEGDTFVVNTISYVEDNIKPYNFQQVYSNLPLDEIKKSFFTKYGYELSFELYSEDDYNNFVKKNITMDKLSVDYYENNKETDSKQTVAISFSVDPFYKCLGWYITLTLPNGKQIGSTGNDLYWSVEKNIVDKDNAAIIVDLEKNIYIQQIEGENYNSFRKNNDAEGDGFYYVPAGKEIEFIYTVNDPGNAFVAGGYWEYQINTFTFEKGKKYKLTYKIDRNHFLKTDWTVKLIPVEIN